MQKSKRFGAILLALIMLAAVVPVLPAATALSEGDFQYTITDGKATITGGYMPGSTVRITFPDTIGGAPVTKIGDYAFHSRESLTEVIIPEGVTELDSCTFGWCPELRTVYIPKSVTSIHDWTFYDHGELTFYGYEISYAYDYANRNGISFVCLDTYYTIRFETNGGGSIPPKTVAEDGRFTPPASPVKSGYLFDGWHKDAELQAKWDFAKDVVTGDMTLYAKWEPLPVGAKTADISRYTLPIQALVNTDNYLSYLSASVSSVSQFVDSSGRIGFAYEDADNLYIEKVAADAKSTTVLTIPRKYPKLGAVSCDSEGNYYVVWGRDDEAEAGNVDTIAISKYDGSGNHIQTSAHFSDTSNSHSSKFTKIPFDWGNCSVAIHNGVLVASYARTMYKTGDGNNHQSNAVIAANTTDMSLVTDINAYTSHSFDQRVIYYEKANDFVFADQGDSYGRGFCITTSGKGIIPFSFYKGAVYQETHAQLGGIGEVSTGLALVGSSAKSLTSAAETERKQLFIQIFDPTKSVSPYNSAFTGETRTDADGNPVDYNVKWLTSYTAAYVENPQMVVTDDDRIVILWEQFDNNRVFAESLYMILSANGDVLQNAVSIGAVRLNAFEEPQFIDGAVTWVTASGENAVINQMRLMPKDAYTVKFDKNGGSGTMEDQIYAVDQSANLTANSFTRKGYSFNGWNTEADGSGTQYTDKASVNNIAEAADNSITLYAQWKANTYTVKFNKNGGSGTMSNQSFTYEKSKDLAANKFTRKNYLFNGWNTKRDGSGTQYANKQSVKNLKTSGSITLYARWTKVSAPTKAVTSLKLTTPAAKQLKVTYKAVSGANGYRIEYSTSKSFTKATTKSVHTTKLTYTLKSLTSKKTYYVRVTALKLDSQKNKIYSKKTATKNLKTK